MSINIKIFESFSKVDQDDQKYIPLLVGLLLFESNNPGWYKDYYRNLIKEHTERFGAENEN